MATRDDLRTVSQYNTLESQTPQKHDFGVREILRPAALTDATPGRALTSAELFFHERRVRESRTSAGRTRNAHLRCPSGVRCLPRGV
eukprot:6159675-Prymnesium_polylepis.1